MEHSGAKYEGATHGNESGGGTVIYIFDLQVHVEIEATYGTNDYDYIDSLLFVIRDTKTGEETRHGPIGTVWKYSESLKDIFLACMDVDVLASMLLESTIFAL